VRRGSVSRSEAVRLNQQLWQLRRLEDQYDNGGFTSWERTDLERRIATLTNQLRLAEGGYGGGSFGDRGGFSRDYSRDYDRNGDGYDDRGGYNSSTQWSDDYVADGNDYDRDDDGWDDRDLDRDGGWQDDRQTPGLFDPDISDDDDDSYYDNGAPVDPRLGGDDDGYSGSVNDDDNDAFDGPASGSFDGPTGLSVGARAPDDLDPVPPQLRSRYVDGNGVHYRYDEGRVYQIDSRTGVIRWVGELPY
jgi:hypothetical protein